MHLVIKLNLSRCPGRILFRNHPICSNLTLQRAISPFWASCFDVRNHGRQSEHSAGSFKTHFICDIVSRLWLPGGPTEFFFFSIVQNFIYWQNAAILRFFARSPGFFFFLLILVKSDYGYHCRTLNLIRHRFIQLRLISFSFFPCKYIRI
jgi:hypothetical protein